MAATINADCAPWDGMAFTVSIPYGAGDAIDISVWQAPDIKRPMQFRFPDASGRVGSAAYRTAAGNYQMLQGTVSFDAVEAGHSVEGDFVLAFEHGRQYSGRFLATWGTTQALCG